MVQSEFRHHNILKVDIQFEMLKITFNSVMKLMFLKLNI